MLRKYVLHQFYLGDVEDPDLYAKIALQEWLDNSAGQFAMDKSNEIGYRINSTPLCTRVQVLATMEPKHYTMYMIKKT